jgi:hypothetical protein
LDVRSAGWNDPFTMASFPDLGERSADPSTALPQMPPTVGPSLAKSPPGRIVRHHTLELVAVLDGWWAYMLDHADVVSEGGVSTDAHGSTYYGTTSVRCRPEPRPQVLRELDAAGLARLLLADPHARLRLVRLVHREVAARVNGPLEVVRVDLRSCARSGGGSEQAIVEVAAEITAPLGCRARRRATR